MKTHAVCCKCKKDSTPVIEMDKKTYCYTCGMNELKKQAEIEDRKEQNRN